MVTTLIISLLTFVLLILSIIFLPKIKIGKIEVNTYWVIALIGALSMVAFNQVSLGDISLNLFNETSSINPIKILALFFSMTFISIFLEEAGFFKYIASVAAKRAGKNQLTLFVVFYFLTALLTIFTSNDIVILTFTPFICYFSKHAKINPIPYVIAEFAAANTWSMILIIGNPTNMYLGSIASINFIDYFKVMAIPTLCAGIVEFLIIILLFRKSLKKEMFLNTEIEQFNNKIDVIFGLIHLGVCLVLLALSNVLSFPMWLVSVCVAGSLLIYFVISRFTRKSIKNDTLSIAKKLPWALIPFVLSMFVIVVSLNKNGIADLLRNFLGQNYTIWTYGSSSFIFANLINNIPMSILYSTLPQMGGIEQLRATYASIVGSNIGAFLTPIGALAGIMFTSLLKEHDIKLSFAQFSFYGVIIAIPTLIITLVMVGLILF